MKIKATLILIFGLIINLGISQEFDNFEFPDLSLSPSSSDKVFKDLLPILLSNVFDIGYPTSDSLYRIENKPESRLDSIYYFSDDEWNYLQIRGFIINDNYLKIREDLINDLNEKVKFGNNYFNTLFDDYIKFVQIGDYEDFIVDNLINDVSYYTFDSFYRKYHRRVQNGVINFSPVLFSNDNRYALFVYMAMWQGHPNTYFVLSENLFEKWRINYMINITY